MCRNIHNQKRHDEKVLMNTRTFIVDDWDIVRADVEGFEKPKEINGHVPDIYAKKDGWEYVVEVETSDTYLLERAHGQKAAFRRWALKSDYRTFQQVLI